MSAGLQLDIFGGPPVPLEEIARSVPEPEYEPEPELESEPTFEPSPIPEGQTTLFDLLEPWKEEWKGMPEFAMEDLTPTRSLLVHFETVGDVVAFERAIGQSVGERLRSVWYPEAEIMRLADKRYANE